VRRIQSRDEESVHAGVVEIRSLAANPVRHDPTGAIEQLRDLEQLLGRLQASASAITQVPASELFECRAIGADDVGIDRFSRGDQPGVVLAEAARGPSLKPGTSLRLRRMKALDHEPLQ
jgi:hypothetical protein